MLKIKTYEQFESLFKFNGSNLDEVITLVKVTTKKGNDLFISLLERFNFRWLSGDKPGELSYFKKEEGFLVYVLNWKVKEITFYRKCEHVPKNTLVLHFEEIMKIGFKEGVFNLNGKKVKCLKGEYFDAEKAVALAMLYNFGVSYKDVKNVLSLIPKEQYKNLQGKKYEGVTKTYFFHSSNIHAIHYLESLLNLTTNSIWVKCVEECDEGHCWCKVDGNHLTIINVDKEFEKVNELEILPFGVFELKSVK